MYGCNAIIQTSDYLVFLNRMLAYLRGIFSLNLRLLVFIGQDCLDLLSPRDLLLEIH